VRSRPRCEGTGSGSTGKLVGAWATRGCFTAGGPTIAVLLGGIRRIPQFFTVPDAIRVAARKFERDGSTLCVGSRSCLSRRTNTRHIGGIVAAIIGEWPGRMLILLV